MVQFWALQYVIPKVGKDAKDMFAKTASLVSKPTVGRWFVGVLFALFVAISVQYTVKITQSERDNRSAFLRWRNQILALDAGENIYHRYNYPNPPIMALLLRPLEKLPPVVGSLTWFYLKVLMVFVVLRLVFRLVENPGQPLPAWIKFLAVLLCLRPIMGDLTHGNVNIFIMFLVFVSLYAFQKRRDALAGTTLALAIACKLTPVLFVPYFLWKRAWGTLAGCMVGLVVFWWLVPGLWLGFDYNAELFDGWTHQMVRPYLLEGKVTPEHQNQSLPGVFHRLLTHSPSFSAFNGDAYVPVEYHNLLALSPTLVNGLLKICMLVFAATVAWTCRNPLRERPSPRLTIEFSLILLAMLLFSERTWKHHCVTLILPVTVILHGLAHRSWRRGPSFVLVVLLVSAGMLMSATSTGLLGDAAKLAQVYGSFTCANLVLMVILVILLHSARKDVAESQPSFVLAYRIRAGEISDTPSTICRADRACSANSACIP